MATLAAVLLAHTLRYAECCLPARCSLQHAKTLLERIIDTNNLVECVGAEIEVSRLRHEERPVQQLPRVSDEFPCHFTMCGRSASWSSG